MIHKISMRISNETFRSLQEEAKKYRVKISVVARCRLMQPNEILPSRKKFDSAEDFSPGVMTTERGQAEIYPGPRSQSEFAVLETLYLLREFLFERNAQILKRIDEKMEKRFGIYRQRI